MKSSLLFLGFGGAGLAAAGTGIGVYYGINGSEKVNQVEQRENNRDAIRDSEAQKGKARQTHHLE